MKWMFQGVIKSRCPRRSVYFIHEDRSIDYFIVVYIKYNETFNKLFGVIQSSSHCIFEDGISVWMPKKCTQKNSLVKKVLLFFKKIYTSNAFNSCFILSHLILETILAETRKRITVETFYQIHYLFTLSLRLNSINYDYKHLQLTFFLFGHVQIIKSWMRKTFNCWIHFSNFH